MKWFLVLLLLLPTAVKGQTEDDFLPTVRFLVMDSTELAAQRFCKEVMAQTDGFRFAFVDREDVMLSKYVYDNPQFETVKFEYQFGIDEVMGADSVMRKNRVVKLIRITAELAVMAKIYNYIFNETHTPDNIIAVSAYEKPINYKTGTYNSSIIADDFKAGYWILSFFRL